VNDEEIRARFDDHDEGIWVDAADKWWFAWLGKKYGPFNSQEMAEIWLESEIERARKSTALAPE
jgi:hypothetical protein